jgi:hypothetical protein
MKAVTPPAYASLRDQCRAPNVTFGYSGVKLLAVDEIPDAQLGYGNVPEGNATDWKSSWLVIGHDTSLGDPLFIDTAQKDLPVFTAPHGEGTWSPRVIAPSAKIFFELLLRFAALAKGREDADALEEKPLGARERARFLDHLAKHFGDDLPVFWTSLVDTDP